MLVKYFYDLPGVGKCSHYASFPEKTEISKIELSLEEFCNECGNKYISFKIICNNLIQF